jgi:hypothetical protein
LTVIQAIGHLLRARVPNNELLTDDWDRQIFKKKKPPVDKPTDRVKLHRFMRKIEADKIKEPEKSSLCDYDRMALKIDKHKKIEKNVGKGIPQLGTQ